MKLSYLSFVLILCVSFSFAFSQSSREVHKVLPLKADGRLVIETNKGSITITTHDKPLVEVDVRIESDDGETEDAAMDVEDTEIRINAREDEVVLHTDYRKVEREHHRDFWDWISDPSESSYSLPLVHYTIRMPRTAALRIKDYKSTTHIEGLQSDIRFNTYKGEANIEGLSGGIDLETYKGTVRVSFAKLKTDSRFETYKGKVTAAVPKENGFDLQTDFERHVDFTSDFDVHTIERDRKHRAYDYRGSINGGGPALEFKSSKGNIRLRTK
jgi:hypothetical protein